jgi:hypothetical protein
MREHFDVVHPQTGEVLIRVEFDGPDPEYKRLFAFEDALRQAVEADRIGDVVDLLENDLPTLAEGPLDHALRFAIPMKLAVERFTPALERAVAAAYAGRRLHWFQEGAWLLADRIGWLAREGREGEAGVARAQAVLDALLFETPPPPLEINDEIRSTMLLMEVLGHLLPAWSARICEEVYHRFRRTELRASADPSKYVHVGSLRSMLGHVAGVRTLPESGYRMLLSYYDVRVDEVVAQRTDCPRDVAHTLLARHASVPENLRRTACTHRELVLQYLEADLGPALSGICGRLPAVPEDLRRQVAEAALRHVLAQPGWGSTDAAYHLYLTLGTSAGLALIATNEEGLAVGVARGWRHRVHDEAVFEAIRQYPRINVRQCLLPELDSLSALDDLEQRHLRDHLLPRLARDRSKHLREHAAALRATLTSPNDGTANRDP